MQSFPGSLKPEDNSNPKLLLLAIVIVLSILFLIFTTSCSSQGPIRYLSVQSEYSGYYNSTPIAGCDRQLHPYHYRSPSWYKAHIPKDNVSFLKFKDFKRHQHEFLFDTQSCFNVPKVKKVRYCNDKFKYNVPCKFSKIKYKSIK